MRVLIVEDDEQIRWLVEDRLTTDGNDVTAVGTIAAAKRALLGASVDLVVLDLTLPDGGGSTLLEVILDLPRPPHVLVLSGANTEADRVAALEAGADDYVMKPFSVREVAARVAAVGRRRKVGQGALDLGSLRIDLEGRAAEVDGERIDLSPKEFDLLAFLATRPGQVFSREEILAAVWASSPDWQQVRTVTEHVRRLRGKIEVDPANPTFVMTVPRIGYRFDPGRSPDPVGAATTEAVVVIGGDGIVRRANRGALELLGATDESTVLGRHVSDFVATGALGVPAHAVNPGYLPWARRRFLQLRRLDGSPLPAEVTSSDLVEDGETLTSAVVRPASEHPRELREVLEGPLRDVSDAVIITDPAFYILQWNEGAERLYGWTEDEVIGQPLGRLLPWMNDVADFADARATLFATGRWFGEGEQVGRDGTGVPVSASTSLIHDEAGNVVGVVSVNRPGGSVKAWQHTDLSASNVRGALARGEVVPWFQPIVDLRDGRLVGVEALARWEHPDRGVLLPRDFMGAAERSNAIMRDLGRAILDQACAAVARWLAEGVVVELNVNVSARQLAAPSHLAEDIADALSRSGLAPGQLGIEVTETAIVEDVPTAIATLRAVADLGVRVAIDDFGTGWASLTYLQLFPVGALKIDSSFIADIEHNERNAAIARSVLSLGAELGLDVVAEGVERTSQLEALRSFGCRFAQGYLFGRPAAAGVEPPQVIWPS